MFTFFAFSSVKRDIPCSSFSDEYIIKGTGSIVCVLNLTGVGWSGSIITLNDSPVFCRYSRTGFNIRLSRISSVGLKVRAESDYNEDI